MEEGAKNSYEKPDLRKLWAGGSKWISKCLQSRHLCKSIPDKVKKLSKFQDLFLMISTFHIKLNILNFLAVISAQFKYNGIRDIMYNTEHDHD